MNRKFDVEQSLFQLLHFSLILEENYVTSVSFEMGTKRTAQTFDFHLHKDMK